VSRWRWPSTMFLGGLQPASRRTLLQHEEKVNNDLQNPGFRERWAHIAEPAWQVNQEVFNRADRRRTKALLCAIVPTQAERLTDTTFPAGWDANKCLIASVGRKKLPELANWEHTPQIRAVPQLPCFKTLPAEHQTLVRSPWLQSPSQATGVGINAKHLRYHHQLWNELRPKTLRGVHTTLVYATPQLGYSLTSHIRLAQPSHRPLRFWIPAVGFGSCAPSTVRLPPAGATTPSPCVFRSWPSAPSGRIDFGRRGLARPHRATAADQTAARRTLALAGPRRARFGGVSSARPVGG
jgi:hypothetical protein